MFCIYLPNAFLQAIDPDRRWAPGVGWPLVHSLLSSSSLSVWSLKFLLCSPDNCCAQF